MMGRKKEAWAALFYVCSLEDHVPQDHLLWSVHRFVDLDSIRAHLADFYRQAGHPSVDAELLIRILLADRKIAPHISVFHCPAGDSGAICR